MLFLKFIEGLEAVLFIALNSGANPVRSKQICSYQNVLPRHLEPMLQLLVKEGILKSTKGPHGGYTLAKEKRKVLVGEIFSLLKCETTANAKDCNALRENITSKINDEIMQNIEAFLSKITIEDLCKQAEAGVKKGEKGEFSI